MKLLLWKKYNNYIAWSITLFEVPSWVRADKIWRKKLLLQWLALKIIWLSVYVLCTSVYRFYWAWIVLWFASALISGCITSLVYDWYKENDNIEIFPIYSRVSMMLIFIARTVASISAWYLFSLYPTLPYWWMILFYIIVLLLWFQLYESPVHEVRKIWDSTFKYIIDWFNELSSNKNVYSVFLFFVVTGFLWNFLWVLYQPLFQEIWVSVKGIWYLYAWFSLLSAFGAWSTKFLYKEWTPLRVMWLRVFFWIIWFFLVAYLPWYRKILPIVFIQISFWWFWAIMTPYINNEVGSSHRATINSILHLINSVFRFMASWITWVLLVNYWYELILYWLALLSIFCWITLYYLQKKI